MMNINQGSSGSSEGRTLAASYFICLAGLLLIQGLADTLLNLGQLLKDRYYQYEIVFLPISAMLLTACLYRSERNKNLKTPIFIGVGVFFGYLGSFISFYVLPIFAAHGWERFWQPPRNAEQWITLAWSPLIILSWLVGGLASLLVLLLVRKTSDRVVQVSAGAAIIGGLLLTVKFSVFGHVIRALR